MTLSTTALLSERIQYDFVNVSQDELHDTALDLEDWRQLADTPDDITERLTELEEWRDIRLNGMKHFYDTPDAFEDTIKEYTDFYSDCVQTVEEYHGSFMGTDRPFSFHEYIAEEFQKADEYKTALINIRQALKDGESADYIASLMPDNLGE